jgi:hypothetical protein
MAPVIPAKVVENPDERPWADDVVTVRTPPDAVMVEMATVPPGVSSLAPVVLGLPECMER